MLSVKSFDDIMKRVREIRLDEDFDMVVAIARGGIVTAAIMNERLGLQFGIVWLNFRDESHKPVREKPELLKPLDFDPAGRRILLVDDRSRTGATLNEAKKLMTGAALVKTLVMNGKADYSLFDETCFALPWK